MANSNEIVLFTSTDGEISLPVNLEEETVWLSTEQMCELFGRSQPAITRHINNVFSENELVKGSNMHFLHNPSSDTPIQI